VSQPHGRPLATLYPLSINDKECECALGITPHVLSQGDLVYCGDSRPDDGLPPRYPSLAHTNIAAPP
jgi:hypothetical protein